TVLMSQAEMMQIETKYDMTISVEQYLKIIYRKTASLIESTCAIGAGLNPVLKDRAAVFGEFGGKTGFVFQITDDVFDYLGDERRLGKPTGQDWEEGRITLPLIAALENASAAESKTLLDGAESLAVDERKSYWPEIKAFVMKHGGVDAARDMARVYGEEAKQAITPVARGVQKDLLAVSVEYVLKRLN
ncbi:polyprenyl synthetase family protein, partial [bacterium]|nr:polyprenyl synthetase family protein [bacterium]